MDGEAMRTASESPGVRQDVQSYLSPVGERVSAIGCIVPHAGYMYSGQVAGAVFSRLEIPERCLVLCPNHTGRGHPVAIMKSGQWKTPLGTLRIDSDLAEALMKIFPALPEDFAAHQFEHAIDMLAAAKQLGANNAELIQYATSGDISADRDMVVGYAGIIVT